jgi:hypothetical protein
MVIQYLIFFYDNDKLLFKTKVKYCKKIFGRSWNILMANINKRVKKPLLKRRQARYFNVCTKVTKALYVCPCEARVVFSAGENFGWLSSV